MYVHIYVSREHAASFSGGAPYTIGKIYCSTYPTNNALLMSFQLSSDANFLLHKLVLSLQIGAKCAKTCV